MKRVVTIAEAGINHGGDISTAIEMANVAKSAGADIVKFQTYITEKIVNPNDSSFRELKGLELSKPNWKELTRHCEDIGIEFLTTPGDLESLKFVVEELGVKRIKIGSDDLTYAPLVEAAHRTKLPLILSTGMATMDDITDAIFHINNFTLLHCVSLYPCWPGHVNLRSIRYLYNTLSCPVGYSDHTANSQVILAAVAVGACMIEVHFKLDRVKVIDDAVSFTPGQLYELIQDIAKTEQMLGFYGKKPVVAELELAPYLRKGADGLRGMG